ncbi:butyrophilin subfamily 3 member A2-like isoform X1 [Balearica regulorum gibbericeps]|uniref:butyrophilin subfamily 3 member A2-like isoform X1 n=2 Tax=Balearica regulorum gibbericeps TaxID=100784 RepID=UPI003F63D78C
MLLWTQMWLPTSPGGLLSSLVTLHVLRLGSADFIVVGPDRPLRVTVGQDIVLPCHLSPSMDTRSLDIRWIRHQVSETVHHYRNGEDLYREQMEEYDGRTELVRDGLSRGRLDLRISGSRPSDDGQYVCTVTDGASYGEATVDVEVAATGSVPQLSLEAYEDGGIRVVCRSAGWYPQPEVLWKDPKGQHLPSVSQRHSSDERGLFDIEGIIVVTGNRHGKWSCVVRNSRLNQEQETSLHISAPFFHIARPWMVGVGVLLVLSLVFLGLGAYLWRRKGMKPAAVLTPSSSGFAFQCCSPESWVSPFGPFHQQNLLAKEPPWEGLGFGWLLKLRLNCRVPGWADGGMGRQGSIPWGLGFFCTPQREVVEGQPELCLLLWEQPWDEKLSPLIT